MDPRKVLAEVIIPPEDRPLVRDSPSMDMARLRRRGKLGMDYPRYERIINMKWRMKYTDIYRMENQR